MGGDFRQTGQIQHSQSTYIPSQGYALQNNSAEFLSPQSSQPQHLQLQQQTSNVSSFFGSSHWSKRASGTNRGESTAAKHVYATGSGSGSSETTASNVTAGSCSSSANPSRKRNLTSATSIAMTCLLIHFFI